LEVDVLTPQACLDRLAKDLLPPVMWCEGTEFYFHRLIQQETEAALARQGKGDVERVAYSAHDEWEAPQIMAPLSTLSLFGQVTLVQLSSVERLSAKECEALERLAPKDGSQGLLVVGAEKLHKDFMPSKGWLVACKTPMHDKPAEWWPWIDRMARQADVKLDSEARSALWEGAESLAELQSELEKLSLVAPANRIINRALVEQYVSGHAQASIYELMPALASGQVDRSLDVMRRLAGGAEEMLPLLSFLTKEANLLWEARCLIDRRVAESEVLKRLGVTSGRWYHLQKTARQVPLSRFPDWIEALSDADNALKTGGGDAGLVTEMLVYRFCSVMGSQKSEVRI